MSADSLKVGFLSGLKNERVETLFAKDVRNKRFKSTADVAQIVNRKKKIASPTWYMPTWTWAMHAGQSFTETWAELY